jgi:hypothetical protein
MTSDQRRRLVRRELALTQKILLQKGKKKLMSLKCKSEKGVPITIPEVAPIYLLVRYRCSDRISPTILPTCVITRGNQAQPTSDKSYDSYPKAITVDE